jgi:hypothetical protein
LSSFSKSSITAPPRKFIVVNPVDHRSCCWHLPIFDFIGGRSMDDNTVTEDACVICSAWPAAERATRRDEHFSTDYIRMPIKGVCERCQLVFWANLTGCEPPTEH